MKMMMINKWFFFLCFLMMSITSWTQSEGVSPVISYNNKINWETYLQPTNVTKSHLRNDIDSMFIYTYDTLSLPILDDFTKSRFQDYEGITPTSPNVTEVKYFHLFDENQIAPLADTAKFMADTTFRIEVDTTNDGDFTYNYIPLTDITIYVNDLDQYPVAGATQDVWPRYEIYDTLYINSDVSDTVWMVPDLSQDSVSVFEAFMNDAENFWIDQQVYHNYHYAWEPRSLGVATFDGAGAGGYPYDFGNLGSYGEADVMTSKPIDMSPYSVSDSVYLTFLYQAGGRGEMPDEEDSLILEFYTPGNGTWVQQWASPFVEDSTWRTAHIGFDLNALFENGFQFRFKNFASLSGSFDHWHLDYVHLRATSIYDDTLINDLAIMEPAAGLIQPYSYAPWKHYKEDPSFFMKDNYETLVRNNFTQSKLTDPGTLVVEYQGSNELTYNVGDPLGNYNPTTIYDFPFDFSGANYMFDPNVNDSTALFNVISILTTPTNPELLNINDTSVYDQEFLNYYAYDDGTAEAAYGPYGLGAQLAYHFEMPQADTLLGALMHFAPSGEDWSNTIFLLTVWEDDNGEPGEILYQDDFFTANQIRYTGRINGFDFYSFGDDFAVEVPTSFFIGWEQIDPDKLNIGFDYNNNNQDKIFYNTDGTWNSTVFEGSLMIRPVVKSNIDFYLGEDLPEFKYQEKISANVYPNPFNGQLNIVLQGDTNPKDWRIVVQSITGKTIRSINYQEEIDLSQLEAGMYLIVMINEKTSEKITKKVIKK